MIRTRHVPLLELQVGQQYFCFIALQGMISTTNSFDKVFEQFTTLSSFLFCLRNFPTYVHILKLIFSNHLYSRASNFHKDAMHTSILF